MKKLIIFISILVGLTSCATQSQFERNYYNSPFSRCLSKCKMLNQRCWNQYLAGRMSEDECTELEMSCNYLCEEGQYSKVRSLGH